MSEAADSVRCEDLTKEDVPYLDGLDADDWMRFSEFALRYNGYEEFGPACGTMANSVQGSYWEGNPLPGDVQVLRACLFFEQRRWRHFEAEPDEAAQRYILDVVGKLREALPE